MAAAKNLLLGKPFRSPLHPALVHVPIALLPLGLLLDLGSWVCPLNELYLVRGAFLCLAAGLLTGLLAGLVGFVDYSEIRRDHPAKKTATLHMVLNLVALALYGASLAARWNHLEAMRTPLLAVVVSGVATLILAYSGYLGGHLVYSDGVAVGRHRRKPLLPRETIVAPRGRGVFVPVADAAALAEGATLRVKAGDTAIVIARTEVRVHAVQEYCPHRYGPLSEGTLRGCEIVCPWHNSKFDVRSGKVTGGPAKVDLRTFRAEERNGEIWVETPDA